MRWIIGQRISDTQTGLRGIPLAMIPRLLVIPHHGYEFELEMLLVCKYEGIRIRETGIQTIYLDGNRSSHFNPLLDSFRIYFVLLRFTVGVADLGRLGQPCFRGGLSGAGRTWRRLRLPVGFWPRCSTFWGNRNTVFRSREQIGRTLPKYLLLVAVSGGMSYGLIQLFTWPVRWMSTWRRFWRRRSSFSRISSSNANLFSPGCNAIVQLTPSELNVQ